jgi:hypothetical protein
MFIWVFWDKLPKDIFYLLVGEALHNFGQTL